MTKQGTQDEPVQPGTGAGGARRPYSKPELTVYGPLAKLTRGSASGTTESTPAGKKAMQCL